MNLKKGFTLIELLVVIAIIGILSSVVLASLNSARGKGADAAIKANLNGIRSQAELYYETLNPPSYAAAAFATTTAAGCTGASAGVFSDPNIKAAITTAAANAGTANIAGGTGVSIACGAATANSTYWMVAVPLKSDSSKVFCVTSAGQAKEVNASAMTAAAAFTMNACQ